jgi:hypothetical protein
VTAKALPLEELFKFSKGEMSALKRRGMLPGVAELIAEVLMEGKPGPRYSGGRRLMKNCFGAVFWADAPATEFETLVEEITRILSAWGPGCREKLEAIVWARRKALIHVLSNCIEVEELDFPWLGDRLEAIE